MKRFIIHEMKKYLFNDVELHTFFKLFINFTLSFILTSGELENFSLIFEWVDMLWPYTIGVKTFLYDCVIMYFIDNI